MKNDPEECRTANLSQITRVEGSSMIVHIYKASKAKQNFHKGGLQLH